MAACFSGKKAGRDEQDTHASPLWSCLAWEVWRREAPFFWLPSHMLSGSGYPTQRKDIPQLTSFQAFSNSFWTVKTDPSYLPQQFSFCPSSCPCPGTVTVAFSSIHIFYIFPENTILCKDTNTKWNPPSRGAQHCTVPQRMLLLGG